MRDMTNEELDNVAYLEGSDFSKQRTQEVYDMGTNSDRNVAWQKCTTGNLDSDDKGSGARKSAGKAQLDLIPIRYWLGAWDFYLVSEERTFMQELASWQERHTSAYELMGLFSYKELAGAAKVLAFGAKKYKAWNWAKGMPWSVPTGCILRHMQAIVDDELLDAESGEEHWMHVVCNVMMLAWYEVHYSEGDDRPPVFRT